MNTTGVVTYSESIAAAAAELAKAAAAGENILMPAESLQNVPPMHKVTVERVKLSANPDDKDVYVQLGKEDDPPEKKRYALTKDGILKLSSCAGVQWDYSNSGRIDRQDSGTYIAWRMVGAVQKLDGSWLPLQGSYDLDFDVIAEEVEEQKRSNASRYWGKKDWWAKMGKEAQEAYLLKKTKEDVLMIKRHKVARVETGAMLRAIRGLLNIKGTYSYQEISRPFVIARLVFQPDYADPIIKAQAVALAFRAMQGVYGIPAPASPRQLPQTSQAPVDLYPDESGHYGAPDADPDPEPGSEPEPQAPHPTTETPPPAGENGDSALVDFKNCDKDGKITTLNALIKRKGYDMKKLTKPLLEYSDATLLKFFKGLLEMPDAEQDDIPF